MPKYKVLKSVAHNLGHSFLSDSNAAGDPWTFVAQQLYERARELNEPYIRIDFLKEEVTPKGVVTPLIQQSVGWYRKELSRLIESQGVPANAVVSAILEITFDFEHPHFVGRKQDVEVPSFECSVELLDDRGKSHIGKPVEWLA